MAQPWEQPKRGKNPWEEGYDDRRVSEMDAVLSNAADSLSLGFGDEILGGFAGLNAALQGGDFGRAYQDQATASRRRLEDTRYWHPGWSLAGSLAGGLAFGGGVGLGLKGAGLASTALRNLTPMQRIMAGAGSGGAAGAAYGAGSGEYKPDVNIAGVSVPGRVANAATGGAIGAVTGGVLQGAGEGLGHLWRSAGRTMIPEERASAELGKALQRTGMDEAAFRARVGELQQLEQLSPGSNPMVMDALGDAGTDAAMAAATRPSAERGVLRDLLDERNKGARERITSMLWREIGGGQRRGVISTLEGLEAVQKKEAAPLFAEAYKQTVRGVPQPLRQFIAFNDRAGARFKSALETTRETMRRAVGDANVPDEAMMQSPVFWHRLLENVSAEVGASIRAAKMTPLQAPRGSAVADMTQDYQVLNAQVRRLLGPTFRQAMDKYAGAARNMDAIDLGSSAVKAQGELKVGTLVRRLNRMSAGEREQARFAAITGLSDELARADTGKGRSDVLRAIIGNDAKRQTLTAIFGGEANFARVMRALDYERELFDNTVNTGIRVNSITADKYFANQQMFAPNEIGGFWGAARRAIGREVKEQSDEALANRTLELLRTPLTGQNSANVFQLAEGRGLLARALKEAERRRSFRSKAGPLAITAGAANAVGWQ